MFEPLAHPPGHAQADFGEALAVIGGVERKIHFLVMERNRSWFGFRPWRMDTRLCFQLEALC